MVGPRAGAVHTYRTVMMTLWFGNSLISSRYTTCPRPTWHRSSGVSKRLQGAKAHLTVDWLFLSNVMYAAAGNVR